MSTIRVQQDDFDLSLELALLRVGRPGIGAVVSFVGLVRDVNAADSVSTLTLEHYPGMTEKVIGELVAETERRWDLIDVTVIHRVGALEPSDQIVLVMVASGHRRDAFDACQFLMDLLKTRAPFWKKETTPTGSRWVEARPEDEAAVTRWKSGEGDDGARL
jgi:molybdopterin synthase catalytic subunit